MQLPESITICEVGPRDGLQNEKHILSAQRKIELINDVVNAGVKVVEIGSFVSPKAVPQLADTDEVAKGIARRPEVEYRALISNLKGMERAIFAGITKVKLTVSASESHNKSNWNRSTTEVIRGFYDAMELAAKSGLEVSGAISTAFGCPFEGNIPRKQILDLVQTFISMGVTEISLSDTTGMAYPSQVYEVGKRARELFPSVRFWLHLHNTRGLAMANMLAGMQAGIVRFDASFSGLGGCPYAPGASGNVATEDVIHMCDLININTGINLDKMIEIAQEVRQDVRHETESFILKAGKSLVLSTRDLDKLKREV